MTPMKPDFAMNSERWIEDGRAEGLWREARQRPAYPHQESRTTEVSGTVLLDVPQVEGKVCCSISRDRTPLAAEFLPGRLPVALLDSVLHPGLPSYVPATPVGGRDYRHFGIAHTRTKRRKPPPANVQKILDVRFGARAPWADRKPNPTWPHLDGRSDPR